MVAFNGLCGFFIGVWSITLILEHLIVVFLFLEGSWSDTFYFCFLWLLIRCQLWITWGSGDSVAPPIHWGVPETVFWSFLGVPLISSSPALFIFVRGSAPPSMGVLGHAFLACPWPSPTLFISSFRELYWWTLYSSLPYQSVWFIRLGCCLHQDFLRSRFIVRFRFGAPAWRVSDVPCSLR